MKKQIFRLMTAMVMFAAAVVSIGCEPEPEPEPEVTPNFPKLVEKAVPLRLMLTDVRTKDVLCLWR